MLVFVVTSIPTAVSRHRTLTGLCKCLIPSREDWPEEDILTGSIGQGPNQSDWFRGTCWIELPKQAKDGPMLSAQSPETNSENSQKGEPPRSTRVCFVEQRKQSINY